MLFNLCGNPSGCALPRAACGALLVAADAEFRPEEADILFDTVNGVSVVSEPTIGVVVGPAQTDDLRPKS